ncbi:hypothetical protein [Plantactinospora endophytica]|uniref:hypothetical protein n=1 Tax=Plantactinospora endophytica TaxID=673535 RepID=UPI001EF22EDC|nr:hypothetical protein [Plantactinospora endophytica]
MATRRRTAILCGAPLAVTTVLAAILGTPAPARAADVFVQVNPSTVEAGFMVGIKASCTSNTQPATVESEAFGTVTVQPQAGFLTAVATVPEKTRADTYRVRLSCPDGKNGSTRLMVVGATRPNRGPATGFGGSAGDDRSGLLVAGGLGSTVLGALLGLVALRRRTRSTPPRRT